MDKFEVAVILPAVLVTPPDRSGSDAGKRRFPSQDQTKRRREVDVASMLGVPLGTIAPAVQDCVTALVEEVERLRDELEQARHIESFLAIEADHHPLLPMLNRRAFLRGLTRLVDTSERASLPGSLVYVHLAGIETLRAKHGLAASDGALNHAAQLIGSHLRQTDLVGYLDGGDFAVGLALAEAEAAEEKARKIAALLLQTPFDWNGGGVAWAIRLGIAHFRPGVTAEDLLIAGDAARRGILTEGTQVILPC